MGLTHQKEETLNKEGVSVASRQRSAHKELGLLVTHKNAKELKQGRTNYHQGVVELKWMPKTLTTSTYRYMQ